MHNEWGLNGMVTIQGDEASTRGNSASRYVIVVEHDLAVLDYMSDYVCCLYGK